VQVWHPRSLALLCWSCARPTWSSVDYPQRPDHSQTHKVWLQLPTYGRLSAGVATYGRLSAGMRCIPLSHLGAVGWSCCKLSISRGFLAAACLKEVLKETFN